MMKRWLKITGYIIFLISCILWGFILIVPWLGLPEGRIAAVIAILVIAGEITFYLSIFILGRSLIEKIKGKFKFWKKADDRSDGKQEIKP